MQKFLNVIIVSRKYYIIKINLLITYLNAVNLAKK